MFHLFRPGGVQNYAAVFLCPFFWRREALLELSLFACLFVCLFVYFSGPKKLLL